MADRLTFELSMMDAMSGTLRPIVANLDKTEDAMSSVRVSADLMSEAIDQAQKNLKRFGGSAADHAQLLAARRALEAGAQTAYSGSALGKVLGGYTVRAEEMDPLDPNAGPRKWAEKIEKFKRLRFEMGNFVHSFAGLRREINDAGESIWTWNMAEGFGAIGRAVSSATRYVYDFAAANLKAVAGQQDLDLAARRNLGAGGVATMGGVTDMFGGGRTRFDDDAVKRGLLPVMRAGVRDQRLLEDLATAAGDIEAMTAGETKMGDALAALGKMRVKRDFGEKQLEALGLNADDVYAALAKQIGKSLKTTKALAGEGKIAGDVLLGVVLNKVAEAQGGELGRATLESGKTLGATLQRLSDLPENMLKANADSPAVKGLQKALDDFVTQMSGPTGAAIMGALADALRAAVPAMNLLARGITALVGGTQQDVERTTVGVQSDLTQTAPTQTIKNFRGEDVTLGGGEMQARLDLMDVRKALVRGGRMDLLQNALMGVDSPGYDEAEAEALRIVMRERGNAAGKGMAEGIRQATPEVAAASEELAGTPPAVAAAELEIRSPSRVMRRLFSYVGEGAALGIEDGSSRVSAALGDMLTLPQRAGHAGGVGSEGGELNLTIVVPGYQGGAEDTVIDRFLRRVVVHYAAPEPA